MAGGSSTKSSGGMPAAIQRLIVAYANETQPLRSLITGQTEEAYRTGGVGAQIPIIQSMLSSTNRATSDTLRGLDDSLAGANLTGTPYGQRIRALTQLAGRQQASGVQTNLIQQLMSSGTNDVLSQIIPGLSGIRREQSVSRQGNVL